VGRAAGIGDLLADGIARLGICIQDHDRRAMLGVGDRDAAADPGGAARDHGAMSLEQTGHAVLPVHDYVSGSLPPRRRVWKAGMPVRSRKG
jgi:hypothetical protein